MNISEAYRAAEGLESHGWIDDRRHYDGDWIEDIAQAIMEYANDTADVAE